MASVSTTLGYHCSSFSTCQDMSSLVAVHSCSPSARNSITCEQSGVPRTSKLKNVPSISPLTV
ncbi:hypothetical protein E2C01_020143 [Portunus trituberculatus]|uniref:Uncharacterized protein n=1 Tax=Portunus trituberculatus TaxID=210409 RepID=A0A5B7DZ68_PORTR|nr:hypothetical protein [Portunus trituberculatus]